MDTGIDGMISGEGGRSLRFAPVTPEDVDWINQAVDLWQGSLRWSIASQVPEFRDICARTWVGMEIQRAVWLEDAGPLALIQLVEVDLHNEVAGLELLVAPPSAHLLRPAVERFVSNVADVLPLRKITFGCVSGALPVAELLGDRAVHLATRPRHERAGSGQFHDVDLYEVWCEPGGAA